MAHILNILNIFFQKCFNACSATEIVSSKLQICYTETSICTNSVTSPLLNIAKFPRLEVLLGQTRKVKEVRKEKPGVLWNRPFILSERDGVREWTCVFSYSSSPVAHTLLSEVAAASLLPVIKHAILPSTQTHLPCVARTEGRRCGSISQGPEWC